MTDSNDPSRQPADDDTQPIDFAGATALPEPAGDAAARAASPTPPPPAAPVVTPAAITTSSTPATQVSTIGPATPASSETTFSPAPEPTWAQAARERATGPTPGAWFEAAPTPVTPTKPVARSGALGATSIILVASITSAVLASGGTLLALNATGALDRQAAAPTTSGQQTSQQSARFDESSAIIDAARKVNPAVVQITSVAVDPNNLNNIPETGVGSGVIFDSNGWILTNRHVVSGSDRLRVALNTGKTYDGHIYGIDTLTDLAIVKVDATGLPTATMGDSSQIKVGQTAIAIGSPLGTYTNTVTSGIVSAIGRSIAVEDGALNNLIQTDTAINPGNSGGPLLDGGGNVIGINTAVASNAQGIGFAIPINLAKPLLQQALAGEHLARPWIGIRYQPITPDLVQSDKLPIDHGALVGGDNAGDAVVADSPAAKAGIKAGDIVTSIEGTMIDSEHPLDAVLTQFAPGRTVTLEIYRNGSTVRVQVTLGTRPAN